MCLGNELDSQIASSAARALYSTFVPRKRNEKEIEYLLHAIYFYSIKFKIRSVGDVLAQSLVIKENKEEREKKVMKKEEGRKGGKKGRKK